MNIEHCIPYFKGKEKLHACGMKTCIHLTRKKANKCRLNRLNEEKKNRKHHAIKKKKNGRRHMCVDKHSHYSRRSANKCDRAREYASIPKNIPEHAWSLAELLVKDKNKNSNTLNIVSNLTKEKNVYCLMEETSIDINWSIPVQFFHAELARLKKTFEEFKDKNDPLVKYFNKHKGEKKWVNMTNYSNIFFNSNSIQQHSLGNCTLIAVVESVMLKSPEKIYEKFINSTINDANFYGVKLFKEKKVEIYEVSSEIMIRENRFVGGIASESLWFTLLEKAFYKYSGGVEEATKLGACEIYSAILGCRSIFLEYPTLNTLIDYNKKYSIGVLCSKRKKVNSTIPNNHAFTLVSSQQQRKFGSLTLRNPWGWFGEETKSNYVKGDFEIDEKYMECFHFAVFATNEKCLIINKNNRIKFEIERSTIVEMYVEGSLEIISNAYNACFINVVHARLEQGIYACVTNAPYIRVYCGELMFLE